MAMWKDALNQVYQALDDIKGAHLADSDENFGGSERY